MSHEIDSGVTAASKAEVVRPVVQVALAFDEGTLRFTSAPFDMTVDADADGLAETFQGVGDLGKISALQEGAELQPYAGELSLSGIDPGVIALAVGSHYQGRSAKIWLSFLDAAWTIISVPFLAFSGRMDTINLQVGQIGEATVTVQSRMADWENARIRRYTNEDQLQLFPADKGLEFVPQMSEKRLNWGGSVIGGGGGN